MDRCYKCGIPIDETTGHINYVGEDYHEECFLEQKLEERKLENRLEESVA